MKLRYTAAWVGLTTAAMMTASACGADGAKTAAKAVDNADRIMAALAKATDRTEQVGSAEVRMNTDMGTGTPIAMNGTYSWGHGLAFDVDMDTKAAQMQQLHASPTTRVLFVDGAYYYDVDPQASGPLKGKEWMRIDASAIFGDKGAQAFSGTSGGGNPADSMKALKYANDVDDLGKETVDGKSTTHYRAVLDKAHMGRFKDAYTGQDSVMNSVTGGADSMTMDIWVGPGNLPVRLKEQLGTVTVTMDFEKFGQTATVTAPPAGQTADLTEEIRQSREQQG
ncbi:hypothetical protein ACYF6T_16870 [Streptomyces sp. 7R007]